MRETDASDRNEEGLMAHKIREREKVVKHYGMDPHSVSPIRIDGVVSASSLKEIWHRTESTEYQALMKC